MSDVNRRRFLRLGGVACALGVAGCSQAENNDTESTAESSDRDTSGPDTGSEGWTAFQANSQHTGHAASSLSADGLTERWSVESDGGATSRVAIADGTAYFAASSGLWEMVVKAVDVSSGDVLWTHTQEVETTTSSPLYFATPTVADGAVYVDSDAGYLWAFDASTGEKLWQVISHDSHTGTTVADGRVFSVGSSNRGFGQLRALDPETGSVEWSLSGQKMTDNAPVYVDGTLYATGAALFTIDPETGTIERALEEQGGGHLAVSDGTAYIGRRGRIDAVDLDSGELVWERSFEEDAGGHPVIAGDRLLTGTGQYSQDIVRCLDVATGETHWEQQREGSRVYLPPVADDTVLIPGEQMTALDVKTGERKWTYGTEDDTFWRPTVSNGTVFVSKDHHALALEGQ